MHAKLTIVVALLLPLFQAAGQMTGYVPPTPEQEAWANENLIRVTTVKPNRLALQRVAAERRNTQGLVAAGAVITPAEDGAEIQGYKGVASALPAGSLNLTTNVMAYPSAVDNSQENWFPPIRNQGILNSCSAFSTIYYNMTSQVARLRGWDVKAGNNPAQLFSPRFTYNMVNGGGDAGTYHLVNLWIACQNGCATEAEFPYSVMDYRMWPTEASVWRNALSYKMAQVGTVFNIDTTAGLAKAKQMLADGYVFNFPAAVFGWQLSNFSNDPSTTGDDEFFIPGLPQERTLIVTHNNSNEINHAMTVVGYNDHIWCDLNGNGQVEPGEKGALRIANSWGPYWKDRGFVWLSYDALKDSSDSPLGFSGVNRKEAIADARLDWVSARSSYTPTLVAEVTATHGSRSQMKLSVGRSNASTTYPSSKREFYCFNAGAGGSLAFDGTSTPCSATIVLDCTDLTSTGAGNRWYANFHDNSAPGSGTLSSVVFKDSGGAVTQANDTNFGRGLPRVVDNSTAHAFADNALVTNYSPTVVSKTVTAIKGIPTTVELEAFDVNGDTITYTIVAGPSHGTLSGSGRLKSYTADSNYEGIDSFTYRVSDASFTSNTATITIKVGAAKPGVFAEFFQMQNNGIAGLLSLGTPDLTRFVPQINYQNLSNFPFGYDQYFATRHTGFINIPTAGNYTFYLWSDNTARLWIDGDFVIQNSNFSDGGNEPSGAINLSAGYHTIRIEHCQEYGGAGLILSWDRDETGKAVVPSSAFFHSRPTVNSAPVAQALNLSIPATRTKPYTITVVASDADMDPLAYTATIPTRGTLTGAGPIFLYTPMVGSSGIDSFTYKVNDGVSDSNTATVTITLTNTGPTVATTAFATPAPLIGKTATLSVLGASSMGESSLKYTWSVVGNSPAGVSFSSSATNATKTCLATFTAIGQYTFRCTIQDTEGAVATSDVTMSVMMLDIPVGPPGFTWVCLENTSFTLPEAGDVAYGADGRFTILTNQTGTINFDNVTFNPDPAPGAAKSGFFKPNTVNNRPTVASAATAAPSDVLGTSTTLRVLGADGGGESNLTYNWATTGTPPAGVSFGANGSNAAKVCAVTFTRAGIYTFQCTIRDSENLTVASDVTVTVKQASPSSVTMTPASVVLGLGETFQFSASLSDQFGDPLLTPYSVMWNPSNTASGNFNSNGVFVANQTAGGPYTVTASMGGRTGSATVTVVATNPPGGVPELPVSSGLVLRMDASLISGTADGAQLNTWNDTSGAANNAVRQNSSSVGYPKYIARGINGRPVVRFNSSNTVGDYLKFNPITTARTVFWVIKENANLADGRFLLGSSDPNIYDFHRGSANGMLWDITHASASVRNGSTKLMGSSISGTTTALPSGSFQLVSLVTTGNVSADQICQDRTFHGSWQGDIAEILIYDRPLNDEEESQVGTYLSHKYQLPTSYNALPVSRGLVLRMDASKISGAANGAQLNTWKDMSTSGNDAIRKDGSSSGYPKYVSSGLNGLPVVRFNSASAGAGDSFKFNRITNIQSVFWVMKENSGLADSHFLLGDENSYHFHRGGINGPVWSSTYTDAKITGGVTKLMGSAVNGTTTSLPSGNFQLVSLVTTGNVEANQICQDRTFNGSWQGDIAEILIYNRALTPAEEVMVGSYLTTKYRLTTSYPLSVVPATPGADVTPFTAWASDAAQRLTMGTNSGPTDDPDRDGIPNLLEFVLGGEPMRHSRLVLPVITKVGGNWFLEYSRSSLARGMTTQAVEHSSDLKAWTEIPIPVTTNLKVTVTTGTLSDRIKVMVPTVVGKPNFIRLKASP